MEKKKFCEKKNRQSINRHNSEKEKQVHFPELRVCVSFLKSGESQKLPPLSFFFVFFSFSFSTEGMSDAEEQRAVSTDDAEIVDVTPHPVCHS